MRRLFPVALLVAASWAQADLAPTPLLPAYRTECSACHLAYPAALLPAASWQRLMAGLDRHFGSDASLDPATARAIGSWLAANAGTYKKVQREAAAPPQDRITRAPWFVREHDEVPAATRQRADVKSASHCVACHTRADEGDFSERQIRVPR